MTTLFAMVFLRNSVFFEGKKFGALSLKFGTMHN